MLPPGVTCPFLHLHEARYPCYPWVERGTVQVSILPKDVISNEPVSTVLGSNPGPWDYNPNTLTTEPPRFQLVYLWMKSGRTILRWSSISMSLPSCVFTWAIMHMKVTQVVLALNLFYRYHKLLAFRNVRFYLGLVRQRLGYCIISRQLSTIHKWLNLEVPPSPQENKSLKRTIFIILLTNYNENSTMIHFMNYCLATWLRRAIWYGLEFTIATLTILVLHHWYSFTRMVYWLTMSPSKCIDIFP